MSRRQAIGALRAVSRIMLGSAISKTLRNSELTVEEVEDVISLINVESFCDLVESIYDRYTEELLNGSVFRSPEEYFLAKFPEQVRIWEQTNIAPLVAAVKEGY